MPVAANIAVEQEVIVAANVIAFFKIFTRPVQRTGRIWPARVLLSACESFRNCRKYCNSPTSDI